MTARRAEIISVGIPLPPFGHPLPKEREKGRRR